jgi:hypothetical protein
VLVVALLEVKEAVTPLGRPEAARLTLLAKPPVGFTVIVVATLFPCVTIKLPGGTDSVKFGAVTVSSADVLRPPEVTLIVEVPAAIPVAKPVALTVATAVLLLTNVREPSAMESPY